MPGISDVPCPQIAIADISSSTFHVHCLSTRSHFPAVYSLAAKHPAPHNTRVVGASYSGRHDLFSTSGSASCGALPHSDSPRLLCLLAAASFSNRAILRRSGWSTCSWSQKAFLRISITRHWRRSPVNVSAGYGSHKVRTCVLISYPWKQSKTWAAPAPHPHPGQPLSLESAPGQAR